MLPSSFASDPDHLGRFEREAQTLASLNHPHIAAIHGIEDIPEDAGAAVSRAIVMELVEGDTLADRIARGALPVDEALPIARQIAEALEAAHEAGIVHRDLKVLFDIGYMPPPNFDDYRVARDGRFLLKRTTNSFDTIRVIVHWPALLKRPAE